MSGFVACDISKFFVIICNCWKLKSQVFALCWRLGVYCKSQVATHYAHMQTPSPRYTAKTNGYYLGTYKLWLTPM